MIVNKMQIHARCSIIPGYGNGPSTYPGYTFKKANDKRRKPGARLPIYCPEKMNLIVVKAHFVAENHMDRLFAAYQPITHFYFVLFVFFFMPLLWSTDS